MLTPDVQPTLGSLLRLSAELAMRGIRVSIPAVVVSFDADKATCSAQPLIQEPLPEGGHTADPALADVPVLYPGSAKSRIRFPLRKGDTVLLVFLDRAADGWILSLLLPEAEAPKEQAPAERRWHDVTDVVALPIATAAPARRPVATDRMEIQHGSATLHLTDAGTVLAHDGTDSQAVPLATKADGEALRATFNLHTHTTVTGTGTPTPPTQQAGAPSGTSVLKGK